MKLITVEEHFDTQTNLDMLQQYPELTAQDPLKGRLNHDLLDFNDRIAYMDANGIDLQIISAAGNAPQVLPDQIAPTACAQQNDALVQLIAQQPVRFAGLATLPVNVPVAAATELKRAVTQLGLKGGIISGTVNGQFLDDPKFEPIFAMAAELDVPLCLHPGFITATQKASLYDSKAYSDNMATMMAGAAWGWHMEQGVQLVRIILAGITEKYPDLKLVLGHWGEFVPMFIERLDEFTQRSDLDLPHAFSYYFKRNVFITPSGMLTTPQFDLIRAEVAPGHLMYSEDYPYVKRGSALKPFITNSDLSPDEQTAFAYRTAEKIFKL